MRMIHTIETDWPIILSHHWCHWCTIWWSHNSNQNHLSPPPLNTLFIRIKQISKLPFSPSLNLVIDTQRFNFNQTVKRKLALATSKLELCHITGAILHLSQLTIWEEKKITCPATEAAKRITTSCSIATDHPLLRPTTPKPVTWPAPALPLAGVGRSAFWLVDWPIGDKPVRVTSDGFPTAPGATSCHLFLPVKFSTSSF